MESEDYNNKLRQNLNEKTVYRKHDKALYVLICDVYLLSILLSVCDENLPGPKVNPHLYTLQIISSTRSNTCFANNRGTFNIDYGDTVVDQVLVTRNQHGIFVFRENYHSKVLVNDDDFILTNYYTLDQLGNNKYGSVASELVVPRLIIENSPSTYV